MNCTRAMLTVLMDGIKDAEMWLDYASNAYEADKDDVGNWFKNHARKRIDALTMDYEYIKDKIGLVEKVEAGDEIATALHSHIQSQMEGLERKLEAM